jgi:hypothetical protein
VKQATGASDGISCRDPCHLGRWAGGTKVRVASWADAEAGGPRTRYVGGGTNVRCLPSAGMMDGDRRCPRRLSRDCRARGTNVRCVWLQGAGGGTHGPNLPGVPKSEAPGRSPAGPREYLSPKLPMLVSFVGPDAIAACSFFNVRELGTSRLERAFGGTGGTKVRRVPAA